MQENNALELSAADLEAAHRDNFIPNTANYYSQGAQSTPERETKKKGGKSAPLVVGCMLLSAAVGMGGGYYGAKSALSSNSGAPAVMYQSVDRGTGSSAPGQDTTIMDVVKTAENSVVEIMTESPTMGNFFNQFITDGGGSGVVLTEDGYILTNNHVVEDADKITVRLKNGQTYDAALIGKDAKTDIAVLKIKPSEKLVPVVFGNSDNIAVGEKAIVIGNPLGELGGTVTDGIISALDREIRISGQTMTLLQTNADINPGNSGGGLFNTKGELIGIVNAKYASTELEGLGFAIPSNLAKNAASELIDIGYISGRPAIGVTLVDIQDYRTAMYYNVEEFGVYIMEVLPGSGAEKAGLRQGDRIVSINGEETLQYSDIEAFLRGASVGAQVKVGIDRNGESITKNVTLGEMKPSAE